MGPLAYLPEPDSMPMEAPAQMGGEVVPFPQPEVPEHVLKMRQGLMLLQRLADADNAADLIDEEELGRIGATVVREFKIDENSRKDWETSARRAMDMARQKKEGKSTPWDGASNVKYPLLTTAALQFAARAYPAIVDGPQIVKCKVLGRDMDGIKAAMADRVSQHMSYQLLYELPEWEADMDTCLHQIPVVGCAFKKIYPDPISEAGFNDELVSAFDFVVHQRTKSLETVPRATHVFPLYPHQVSERIRAGLYSEIDLKAGKPDEGNADDDDAPHLFLEQHRYWDADGDGIPEPWIVTVHKTTEKVVRLKAGYDVSKAIIDHQRGKIIKLPKGTYCKFVKIPFLPDPEGGFYDIGFGKLLEAISDVIDTSINQMMDAGTLQNSGGGFIGGAIQLGKSRIKFKPGEFTTVPSAGDDIRKSVVNMEHPGPAPVLFQLLEMMVDAGKDIAAVKDVLTGETPTNQTATSTMAAIEQGLKVFTAIYKRIFRALKAEYRAIFEINKETLNQAKYVALLDEPVEVLQGDYHDDIDVVPVSDPNSVTDMQRMAKAQLLLEQAQNGNPHINVFEATKRALEAARVDKIEEVLVPPPPPDAPKPPTPEEIAIKAKADEAQITLQTKQQSAEIDMQSKLADAELRMQELAATLDAKMHEIELKRQEMELKAEMKWRDIEAKARQIDQRAYEGDIRHEQAKRDLRMRSEPSDD